MSKQVVETINIKELDLNTLNPRDSDYLDMEASNGAKIVIIGKPKTGKSSIIASILHSKRHLIPCGMVFSGTEVSNNFYKKMFPSTFVFNEYNDDQIEKFINRQKVAIKYLSGGNPWSVLIIDDCTDKPSVFNDSKQIALFKNGRHWKMLYILAMQYCMDIRPSLRATVDGVFILREPNVRFRKSIYDNYASIIPSFELFCEIMDTITNDFTALYIANIAESNNWKDCVFWYKGHDPKKILPFKFGSQEVWDFHNERFDPESDNFV